MICCTSMPKVSFSCHFTTRPEAISLKISRRVYQKLFTCTYLKYWEQTAYLLWHITTRQWKIVHALFPYKVPSVNINLCTIWKCDIIYHLVKRYTTTDYPNLKMYRIVKRYFYPLPTTQTNKQINKLHFSQTLAQLRMSRIQFAANLLSHHKAHE